MYWHYVKNKILQFYLHTLYESSRKNTRENHYLDFTSFIEWHIDARSECTDLANNK